nr:MAG TPA: hypothetical protein [Caudoviricetes sp.]DAW91351.1 MAG TPA: hypothetical protein [Caudoviricetes sp.]DAX77799.1 MAG TPA: hypothetical protein [Caudoviricetes sp.]
MFLFGHILNNMYICSILMQHLYGKSKLRID